MTLRDKSHRALARDAEYFAYELVRRCEALARLYPRRHWQVAAILARRVRRHAQSQLEAL